MFTKFSMQPNPSGRVAQAVDMDMTLGECNEEELSVPPWSCHGKAQGTQQNPPCSLVVSKVLRCYLLLFFWTMLLIVHARTGLARTPSQQTLMQTVPP